jgi:hypothetical protein
VKPAAEPESAGKICFLMAWPVGKMVDLAFGRRGSEISSGKSVQHPSHRKQQGTPEGNLRLLQKSGGKIDD